MFPVYSVTYVPGPYPVLRSLGLLDVLQGVRLRGPRSQALPGRRLRRLAATRREKCGLTSIFFQTFPIFDDCPIILRLFELTVMFKTAGQDFCFSDDLTGPSTVSVGKSESPTHKS